MRLSKKEILFFLSWLIILIILSVFLLRGVLFNGGLYVRDYVFPYTGDYPTSTWNDYTSSPNLEVNKIPLHYLFNYGSNYLGSENFINLFQALVIVLTPLILSLVIYSHIRKKQISFLQKIFITVIPSLFYLLNPWVLERISNHLFMVLGMAFTPLLFYLYAKMLRQQNYKLVIVTAIVGCVISMFSSHNIFYIIPLLFGLSAVILFFFNNKKTTLINTALFFFSYLLLCSYWIIPQLIRMQSAAIQPSYNLNISSIEKLSLLNTPQNIWQLIGGGAWRPLIDHSLNSPLTVLAQISSFGIIAFSLLAFIFYRKNKYVLILGLFLVIFVLLALGTNAPIPIYNIAFESPLRKILWLFRDPSRFIQFVVLIFSVLLAISLYGLFTKNIKALKQDNYPYLIAVAVLIMVISSSAALSFYNKGGNTLIASRLPSEYEEVVNKLNQDDDTYKVIWLPLKEYYFFNWNNVDDVTGDFYSISSPKSTFNLSTQAGTRAKLYSYIYQKLILDYRTEEIGTLLATLNVKYIVIHSDLEGWQGVEAEKLNTVFDLQKDLKKVLETGPYSIYENTRYKENVVYTIEDGKTEELNIENVNKLDQLNLNLINGINELSQSRIEYGEYTDENNEVNKVVKLNVNVKDNKFQLFNLENINAEQHDFFTFDIFPEATNTGKELNIRLNTNEGSFDFNRYSLKLGEWNNLKFDLRDAKIANVRKGESLNLNEVTSIQINIYPQSEYKSHYTLGENNFKFKNVKLVSDERFGNFEPKSFIEFMNKIKPEDDSLNVSKSGANYQISSSQDLGEKDIIFSDTFDSLWRLKSDEKSHNSISVLGMMNGYDVGTDKEMELTYLPEKAFKFGTFISLTSLLLALLIIYFRKFYKNRVYKINS